MRVYNDENIFVATKENVQQKLQGYIMIPILWSLDYPEEGQYSINSETMMEEFQRTVHGIESVLEELTD